MEGSQKGNSKGQVEDVRRKDPDVEKGPYSESVARIRELEALKAKAKEAGAPPTKPWVENRWKRDLLAVHKKPADKHCYWVSQDQVQEFLNKGWTFAHIKDYGGVGDKIVGEESAKGTQVRRREMVLMEQPLKWRKEFEEYRAYLRRSAFEREQEGAMSKGLYPTKTPADVENLTPAFEKEE